MPSTPPPPKQVHVQPTNPKSNSTPKPFPSNNISTTKYTPFNFIFKNLFLQFQKVANVYFLCAGALELVPQFTITNGSPTYLFPLMFILGITAIKDLMEDLSRRTADQQENCRKVEIFDVQVQQKFIEKKWKDVVTGDIVRLHNRDMIPADIVMVASSTEGGLVYVSTANLDGETNLKLRKVHADLNLTNVPDSSRHSTTSLKTSYNQEDDDDDEALSIQDGCRALRNSIITCEHPNKYLHKFDGSIKFSTNYLDSSFYNALDSSSSIKEVSLSRENILLRSCQIRNTKWIVGIVTSTGVDTKIMRNVAPAPHKTSRLMKDTNKLVGTAFVSMIVVCTICSIMSYSWAWQTTDATYLTNENTLSKSNSDVALPSLEIQTIYQFFTFCIIFGNFVPISLYVTLDLVKFLQSQYMNWDLDMYDYVTDTPMKVKSLDLNEELGIVDHIFSDKTGTLTQNVMEFMKCSINGTSYGLGITEVGKNVLLRNGKAIPPVPEAPLNDPVTKNVNFIDPSLWNILRSTERTSSYTDIEEFCLSLALNHDVAPERSKTGEIIYSASSPDESALVSAARHFGYFFYKRSTRTATVSIERGNADVVPGNDVEYTILQTLSFSSKRKRSSVVVQRPNGTLVLYCKGADNIILDRLKETENKMDENILLQSKLHTTQYAADGLRTLMITKKELNEREYNVWCEKYEAASLSLRDRTIKMEQVAEEIEQNLTLLGVTGIEDRLQEGVSDTIASLRAAGIQVWVLTGDKVDTAVNIGYACALLTTSMNVLYLTAGKEGKMLTSKENEEEPNPSQLKVSHVEHRLNNLYSSIELSNKANANSNGGGNALVVDTYALACVEKGKLEKLFLKVASLCKSVVCARVSPAQKATVVKAVRLSEPKLITLAIGDGANDVPMIQTAHIGIGISGQEGLQAVNSSDYAIAQFSFLKKLILVHGRFSSRRISFVINYIFYKNILAVIPAFLYGFTNVMSGRLLFNVWMQQTFNLVTAIPIAVYGVLDRDVEIQTATKFPQLYQEAKRGVYFSIAVSGWWLLLSLMHACVAFYIPYITYETDVDQIVFGSAVQMVVVFMANVQLLAHTKYFTYLVIGSILFSIVSHLSMTFMMSTFGAYFLEDKEYDNVFNAILGSTEMWGCVIVCSIGTIVVSFTAQHCRSIFCPRPYHICTEIERGSFSKSHLYPTRNSLSRKPSNLSFSTQKDNNNNNVTAAEKSQNLRSNVKVLPTKSSKGLSTSSSFLKKYLTSLFLQYSDVEDTKTKSNKSKQNKEQPKISVSNLLLLLQHRASNQMEALPSVTNNLIEQDVIELIIELGDAVADVAGADKNSTESKEEDLSLFRGGKSTTLPPITSTTNSNIKTLSKTTYNSLMKKLIKKIDLKNVANESVSNGYLACKQLVNRSNALLNTRHMELGNIFDAYDADGSAAMSSNELQVLLEDITKDGEGGRSRSGSDSNPQADEEDEDQNNTNESKETKESSSFAAISLEELELFIAAMDSNGDGKLGRDEFLDYCMRGMNMTKKQRKSFSKRSVMHSKLQLFVNNILKRIEQQ